MANIFHLRSLLKHDASFFLELSRASVDVQSEVQGEAQSEDYRRVRTTKKRNPKRVVKHSSTASKIDILEKIEHDVPSAVVVMSEADIYFRNRFLSIHKRALKPFPSLPDSVFYFPTAMVGCLNSGDNLGLADLLHFTMREECDLGIYCFNSRLSMRSFLKFFEVLNLIHPDRILCISDANVENNHVTTSAVMKFTDCKLLFDYVSKTVNEPEIMSMFNTRADHLKRRLYLAGRSEEEQQEMVKLVESDSDLVIYGSIQVHVTFDEITNKVSGLYLSGGLTSAHPAVEVLDD